MPLESSSTASDRRLQVAQAHAKLLVERFEALPELEKIAFELIAISDLPIRIHALAEVLRLSGLHSYWRDNGQVQLARLMLKLRDMLVDARGPELRAQGGEAMQRAALASMVGSGRAKKFSALLGGDSATALHRIEPEYRSGVRARLRSAGLLGGAVPDQLVFGTYISAHNDPISDVFSQLLTLLGVTRLALLDQMHPAVYAAAMAFLLRRQVLRAEAGDADLMQRAEKLIRSGSARDRAQLLPAWLELMALHGEVGENIEAEPDVSADQQIHRLYGQLRDGTPPEALLEDFEAALKSHRAATGLRSVPGGLSGKLYLACLSLGSEPALIKRREQLVKLKDSLSSEQGGAGFECWQKFTAARMTGQPFEEPADFESPRLDDYWWLALLLHWAGQKRSEHLQGRLERVRVIAEDAGWRWLADQVVLLLDPRDEAAQRAAPNMPKWMEPQARWQTALTALAEVLAVDGGAKTASRAGHSQLRVEVQVDEEPQLWLRIDVLEQRAKQNGYSKGRAIGTAAGVRGALDRLPPDDEVDRRLLSALLGEISQSSRSSFSAGSRTVAALIDHPRVFDRDQPEQPLRAVQGEVELHTERQSDGRIELTLRPEDAASGEDFVWLQNDELRIYRADAGIRRIGEIVGSGIVLPVEAVDQLLQLLPSLARRLKLSADLGELGVSEVEASTQLIAQLEPYRDGLSLRIVVRPLGADQVSFPPGKGTTSVLGQRAGKPVRAERDLEAERAALQALTEVIPTLDGHTGDSPLQIEDPEAALDLLAQLQSDASELSLEWRQGKPIRVARTRGEGGLQLQVQSKRDWFAATGGLALDDGSVVALGDVLKALPSAQGRYLRLDGDRVVALNDALRRRLQVLQTLADERGRINVSGVSAFALDAALDDDSVCDAEFREQLQRMEAAHDLQPAVPAGLQAELRDYQIDGFRFLMRLASWGGGACLADDMGLGKTVQALALLLARAPSGPALVVAPTSVVGNWCSEALRFAPDLTLRRYGEGDREQMLADLGPGDVLMVSYGLLAANIDAFAELEFATLVLDEAQAIKNAATQRAKAVRQIKADFRMAATGTPLENHLGELWSLFRVLNPGLLGSEEQFRRRFLLPLEREPRGPQRDILRRLISPFLLRRTKSEVLSELPPRTEIVLNVEPTEGEARLLAAMRRQAIQALHAGAMPSEQRRFHVLAELTRLRRAACHPILVAPELGLTSSKLEQLIELVRELADNRHRALVFSQFVDYLGLVRERLDAEGISYRYLDGSTSTKARESEVAAFQAGEGSVFLLSLKAGGVGLNLTAADYVIHLDPWWNPAVEQQASDRAHRIGQTRPVTVYKLVLRGSIEEQILALHGAKRELIDQVIGEQATTSSVSVDELLSLLED